MPRVSHFPPPRVQDMTYNLGAAGMSSFHTFISDIKNHEWSAAAADGRGTLWCKQVRPTQRLAPGRRALGRARRPAGAPHVFSFVSSSSLSLSPQVGNRCSRDMGIIARGCSTVEQ